MEVYRPSTPLILTLGDRRVDLTHHALVMGILNRTKDSFFAPAATYDLDAFFTRAETLVGQGADLLDVGGVKAGPGEEVSEAEELDRVVTVIGELARRFDLPLSVDTWRASVAAACYAEGACVGNDISGFADPDYLSVSARAGATVVATHIRLRPRVADPNPQYDDVTQTVTEFLLDRRDRALAAGVTADRIVLDAGLDLGKTAGQSLQLLRDSPRLAALGAPLLLSASNKTFLGAMFDLEVTERREPSLAATALGIASGCRILRVHDVAGTVRVRDAIERLLEVPL
ncbi:MAG TPA: dihydropteroate synthase [Acidimicrobiales bacterium]|nr:dihydropteroate synthase [Acidimicrobiales bacterium]